MSEYFNKKGLRHDGRSVTDTRPITIEAGYVERADGSAYLEWGKNKIVAAVYGPREMLPRHMANPYKGRIRFVYRLAPFSVGERKNPRPGRRDVELSKVSGEALSAAALLENFPNTAIDVYVTVLDADAGTRIAALTAASVALADAGIPMKDMVTGTAVGRVDGKLVIDLDKFEEDAYDAVDMAVAMMPNTSEVVLFQMDGVINKKEYSELLKMAESKCKEIKAIQEAALKKKYEKEFNK